MDERMIMIPLLRIETWVLVLVLVLAVWDG